MFSWFLYQLSKLSMFLFFMSFHLNNLAITFLLDSKWQCVTGTYLKINNRKKKKNNEIEYSKMVTKEIRSNFIRLVKFFIIQMIQIVSIVYSWIQHPVYHFFWIKLHTCLLPMYQTFLFNSLFWSNCALKEELQRQYTFHLFPLI